MFLFLTEKLFGFGMYGQFHPDGWPPLASVCPVGCTGTSYTPENDEPGETRPSDVPARMMASFSVPLRSFHLAG